MKDIIRTGFFLALAMCLSATGALAGTACLSFGLTVSYPGGNAGLAGHVTPNLGCEVGTLENDTDPLLGTVIGFGDDTNDWTRMGKVEDPSGLMDDLQLNVNGDGMSGTFWFADSLFAMNGMTFEVMIVLKGPNSSAGGEPGLIVGYLLDNSACNAGVCTYSYTTPFWKVDKFQNISHLSLFYRKVGVPEPASLLLLGIGLTAAGLIRRKRQ